MKSRPSRILIALLIFLSIGLIISVALNFVIFNTAWQYYLQLNATRLDPLGLTVYKDVDQRLDINPQQTRVVFFGDSRAYSWIFPSRLNRFQFINRGIGAQTSAQAIERFADHVEPLNPQVIIVQICINDLKTIPLFPHLKKSIITTCKANLERIVSESLALETTVILTTIFPLGEIPIERRIVWSDDVAEAIDEVNAFIYSLEGENVIVFDTGAVLAEEQGIVREEYSRDFLHLNETGYVALNERLVDILRTLEK